MKRLLWPLLAASFAAFAQEQGGTHELVGQIGSRAALLTLNAVRNPDASWQLAGEYVILPTQQRRYLEGESSPEIGVTTLREGTTPILFGRSPSGELRGVWREGVFRGTRYAPGGQERERFEFSAQFPSLDAYSGTVRCELREDAYAASLSYSVQSGKVQSFEWRSQVQPGGQSCGIAGPAQQPMKGGLRLTAGECQVTVRELGESLRVAAENCSVQCVAPAALAPVLIDRRGKCQLFRPQAR
jgi:hypothetical protein